MKRALCILAAVTLAAAPLSAQDWPAVLLVDPYPSPYLGDWENDPTLGSLDITNNSGRSEVVVIVLDLYESGGRLGFRGKSRRLLVHSGETVTMNSTDFSSWQTESVNETARQKAVRTGMLPEGFYTVDIRIQDLFDNVLADNITGQFTITHPEPPELIYPIEGETVNTPYPVFQWIPPQLPAGKDLVYTFRMVEMLSGQTPQRALAANFPHYENYSLFSSNFDYPLDGLPLETGRQYVWQVQALDFEGKPVTKNDGLSILGRFMTDEAMNAVLPVLELIAPEANVLVTDPRPVFQWIEPLVSIEGSVYYTLRIAEMDGHQSPREAMALNPPHFINDMTLMEPELRYPPEAPDLQPGRHYAWQVEALDQYGNPVTENEGKSAVRAFTVPLAGLPEEAALIPEWLPVPSNVARLRLRDGDRLMVDADFSPDSSVITVTSRLPYSVPLTFEALTAGGSPPETRATVDLTFDRYTLEITEGSLEASPAPVQEGPFDLSSLGLPVILQRLVYEPMTRTWSCFGSVSLFHRMAPSAAVSLTLTSEGRIAGDLPLSSLALHIPLREGSDRLALSLYSARGVIDGTPSANLNQSRLELEGRLAFLPNAPNPHLRSLNLELILDEGLAVASQSFAGEGEGFELPVGGVVFRIRNPRCTELGYLEESRTWIFDLDMDLGLSFTGFQPRVDLPFVSGIHLTPQGFQLPQISIPDLGMTDFIGYQKLLLQLWAFRMDPGSFDWFAWSGSGDEEWEFRFDFGFKLPGLPARAAVLRAEIETRPLSVLDAVYRGGCFHGRVETRHLPSALEVPLAEGSGWSVSAAVLDGVFRDSLNTQIVELFTAGHLVFPAAGGFQRVETGAPGLTLNPDGVFTGRIDPFQPQEAIPWGALRWDAARAVLSLSCDTSVQAMKLDMDGSLTIPWNTGDEAAARGSCVFDPLNRTILEGSMVIDQPFRTGLPADADSASLVLSVPSGAAVSAAGLVIPDGSGSVLLPGGGETPAEYRGLTFSLPDRILTGGTVAFAGGLSFHVSPLNSGPGSMFWQAAAASGLPAADGENLLLTLPASSSIGNGRLRGEGSGTAVFGYHGRLIQGIQAEFSSGFTMHLHPFGVSGGRIDFRAGEEIIATMDSTGFHPGEAFGADRLFTRLGLPDTSAAYIPLEGLQTEILGKTLRVYTAENQTALLFLPALAGEGAVPRVPVSLDVEVDPVSQQIAAGSIFVTAEPDGALLDLGSRSIGLEIVSLEYAKDESGVYGLKARVRPMLPRSLAEAGLSPVSVNLTASGLKSFNTGFSASYVPDHALATVDAGPNLTITLDGIRFRNDSLMMSGNCLTSLFALPDGSGRTSFHFTARLTGDSAVFRVHTAHWLSRLIPMGSAMMEFPGGEDALSLTAPMKDEFILFRAEEGILTIPALDPAFRITIPLITVHPGKYEIPPVTLTGDQRQTLTLFGLGFLVDGMTFTVSAPPVLDMGFSGSVRLFGEELPFTGLSLDTRGTMRDTVLSASRLYLADSLLTVDTLKIGSNQLQLISRFTPPDPFADMNSHDFVIRVNSRGEWVDESGGTLVEAALSLQSEEREGDAGILLGKEPMDVTCRPASLDLTWISSLTEASGRIRIGLNSYWPGSEESGQAIPITGELRFSGSELTQRQWSVAKENLPTVVLKGLLKITFKEPTIPDSSEFMIITGGSYSLNLPQAASDSSGSIDFDNFKLKLNDFEFGRIHDGELTLGGLHVAIDDFTFGQNLEDFKKYEIEFTPGSPVKLDSTTVDVDFFLNFSGSISEDLSGFSGSIKQLLVFLTDDYFHLLIDDADFEIPDVIEGHLDLIADIPLQLTDFQFRFLIGGRLNLGGKGVAAVGELSYAEREFAGATVKLPGFGIFLAGQGLDIKLTPLPITIEDLGGGLFFNASPEIEDFVRDAVSLDTGTDTAPFMDAVNAYKARFANIMSFVELYLYGAISIPDDAMLKGKVLLMLATDKFRLDFKFEAVGDSTLSDFMSLEGKGFLEVGVPQDFSSFPYAAGNLTFEAKGESPVGGDFISLPEGGFVLEFFVIDAGSWAVHGRAWASLIQMLDADFEIFFGPPGFLFRGKIARTWDIKVATIEAGLELSAWYKWQAPREWGGYGRVWIEAAAAWEAFAGVRGEMGAALIGTPDLYLYGYAELDTWFLGIHWTTCLWAQWQDGKIDGGIGGDSRILEIIAESERVGNEIMNEAVKVNNTILSVKREGFGRLSEEQIRAIIESLKSGQNAFYLDVLKEDVEDIKAALDVRISESEKDEDITRYKLYKELISDYAGTLSSAFSDEQINRLNQNLTDWQNAVDDLNGVLSEKLGAYQGILSDLQDEIAGYRFRLDTLVGLSGAESRGFVDPLNIQTVVDPQTGESLLSFTVSDTAVKRNAAEARDLQQEFRVWLDEVTKRILTVDSMRQTLYASIGPSGDIGQAQEEFAEVLYRADDLLGSNSGIFKDYRDGRELLNEQYFHDDGKGIGTLRNVFIESRWVLSDPSFLERAYNRRLEALQALSGSPIDLDLSIYNQSIAADELAIEFYRTVPLAFLTFNMQSLDSLYATMRGSLVPSMALKDRIHGGFTGHTDALWDRYARVSENLYQLYDHLAIHLRTVSRLTDQPLPVDLQSVKEKLEILEGEFHMSGVSDFRHSMDQAAGRYLPTRISLEWGKTPDLAEFAYRVLDQEAMGDSAGGFQAVGGQNAVDLDFYPPLIQPGRTYASRDMRIETRVRNRAGLAVQAQSVDLSLRPRDMITGIPSSTVSSVSEGVVIAYGKPRFSGYPKVQGSASAYWHAAYSTNNDTTIHLEWGIVDQAGNDISHLFSDFEVGVLRAGEGYPRVMEYRSVGTLKEYTLPLDVEPNTAPPYVFDVRAKGPDGRFASLSLSDALFVDRTPPVFPDDMQASFETDPNLNRVIVRCAAARDELAEPGKKQFSVPIDSLNGYEYKLFYDHENPDTMSWNVLTLPETYDYYTPEYLKYSSFIVIDAGTHPMQEGSNLMLRARSPRAATFNGYSDPVTIPIPRQKDLSFPKPAVFEVAGFTKNGDIRLMFEKPGIDEQSGILGYQIRIEKSSGSKEVIRPYPESETVMDIPGDSVSAGKTVVFPLNLDTDACAGTWFTVVLRTVNGSGVFIQGSAAGCIPPPQAEIWAGLHEPVPLRPPFALDCKMIIQTRPDPYTLMLAFGSDSGKSDLGSRSYYIIENYPGRITDYVILPESAGFGSMVYVSTWSVSSSYYGYNRVLSDTSTIALTMPDGPMFTQVVQSEDDRLVIPILSPAFSGRFECVYQYEIRSNVNGELIRPFPSDASAADFPADEVTAGTRLTLPYTAADGPPSLTVRLKGITKDGKTQTDAVQFLPVPPPPRLKISAGKTPAQFFIEIEDTLDVRVMNENKPQSGTMPAHRTLRAGKTEGAHDLADLVLQEKKYKLYISPAFQGDHVYLRSSSVTAWGKVSESASYTAELPPPDIFKMVTQNSEGMLTIPLFSTGFPSSTQILGYQYGIGTAGGNWDLRGLPAPAAAMDFAASSFGPGDILTLPVNVLDLPAAQPVFVVLRSVARSGEEAVQEKSYLPLGPPPLSPAMIKAAAGGVTLRFQGQFESIQRFGGQLTIHFTLGSDPDGSDILTDRFVIGSGGAYQAEFALSGVDVGRSYHLKAWYERFDQNSMPFRTGLTPPCEPMFVEVSQSGDEALVLPIQKTGFNGAADVAGYRYGIGSAPGSHDIRPLPASGYDFSPDQVQAGMELVIPEGTPGLPKTVTVALQAVNERGVTDLCEASFQPNPVRPVIRLLEIIPGFDAGNHTLRWQVDIGSVDQKTEHFVMRAWRGDAGSGPTIIAKSPYEYPTWDWSYTYGVRQSHPVFECPITMLLPVNATYFVEVVASDRYREKQSLPCRLSFRIDKEFNLIDVTVLPMEP